VKAVDLLAERYKIHHICISPYNSQANGIIKRRHYNVREALVKTLEATGLGWVDVAPLVFWAEQVTVLKQTGHSPFYLAYGIKPTLPFDIYEATYMLPVDNRLSTEDLIARRAQMLERQEEEIKQVRKQVHGFENRVYPDGGLIRCKAGGWGCCLGTCSSSNSLQRSK
jgi:hypothetical protein